jgi:cobalt-zinc-cadmium efflux system protein
MAVDNHRSNGQGKSLLIALGLNLLFAGAEAVIGFFANSLVLLASALHDAGDAVALAISYLGWRLALLPPNQRRTFGYRKVRILVAFVNALGLVVFTVFVLRAAVLRLLNPEPVTGSLLVVMAVLGIIVNGGAVGVLSRHRRSLNIRAALWHLLDDLLGFTSVLVGGVMIHFTGWYFIDPLLSIGVSGLVLFGIWRVFRQSVSILIDATPGDLKFQDVREFILNYSPVISGVHDLHIWTIGEEERALMAHLVVNDGRVSEFHPVLAGLDCALREKFKITHTTFELECGGCKSEEKVCLS